jgi:hypothetical protein
MLTNNKSYINIRHKIYYINIYYIIYYVNIYYITYYISIKDYSNLALLLIVWTNLRNQLFISFFSNNNMIHKNCTCILKKIKK